MEKIKQEQLQKELEFFDGKGYFDEEKEVFDVSQLNCQTSLEDVTIYITEKIIIDKNITFTDCNILIDTNNVGQLYLNGGEVTFENCDVVAYGEMVEPAIYNKNSTISFEECRFRQKNECGNIQGVFIFSEAIDKRIDVLECVVKGGAFIFLYALSTNTYIQETKVESHKGCFIYTDKSKKRQNLSSVEIMECEFIHCSLLDKEKMSDKTRNLIDEIQDEKCNNEKINTLIVVDYLNNGTVSQCLFKECGPLCIAGIGYLQNKLSILNCKIENKEKKLENSFAISVADYNLEIKGCEFDGSKGMYCKTGFSKLIIEDCIFKNIKRTHTHMTGILYIFDEVDEPCIHITNCLFENCTMEGEFEGCSDIGIIFVTAGLVSREQKNTVLVKNCKFNNCKSEKNIRGSEKNDGFFATTIQMVKIL